MKIKHQNSSVLNKASTQLITDDLTNRLFLADCLPEKFPDFFDGLSAVLQKCELEYTLLPNTKDIWTRDYMPVQISENTFIQFKYKPDYLRTKNGLKTISDVDSICDALQIERNKSNLILDGGNVVKTEDAVMMCEKVFSENPRFERKILEQMLRELFEVEKLWFLPHQPGDFTGHADGMVRFLDKNTLLINDYSGESKAFQKVFDSAIESTGLDTIKIPYNPYGNKSNDQANGIYINYLQMQNTLIIPVYGLPEDEQVVCLFEQHFKGQKIETLDCNEIAEEGGVLNCISWTRFKSGD